MTPFSPRRRDLADAVVVITGASSGIGHASALAFAAAGARLVLAARRQVALEAVAVQCRARGVDVLTVVVDVTRTDDLDQLVTTTLARWGRVDIWVNNAGTTLFAGLDAEDFQSHRRVIETNLIAAMYAARLLIPVFRRQNAGTLINVGSVLSQVGQPFVPAYVISKFGILGLTESVRAEFANCDAIHVCTVLPYAVNSPHFEDAANVTGRRAYAMPPAQQPEDVAAAIVAVAERPRRLRYVPRYIVLGVAAHWLLPRTTERVLRRALERFHLVGAQALTRGSLFHPQDRPGAVRGQRGPVVSLPRFVAWVAADVVALCWARLVRRRRWWPATSTR